MALLALAAMHRFLPAQELVIEARKAAQATLPESVDRLDALLAETRLLLRYDLAEATRRADEAVRLASRIHQPDREARALAFKAAAAVGTKGPDAARELLDAAEQRLDANAPHGPRAAVSLARATVCMMLDDRLSSLTALQDAIDQAEQAREPYVLGKALMLAIAIAGWPEDSTSECERILQLADEANSPSLRLEARIYRASIDHSRGDIESSRKRYEALRDEAARLGDRACEAYLQTRLARYHTATDLDQTSSLATRSLELYQAHGHAFYIAESQHYLGKVCVHRNQPARGLELCEQALANLDGMGMDEKVIDVLQTAQHIASLTGNHSKAQAFGERHHELTTKLTRASPINEQGALWRETLKVRSNLRDEKSKYELELAAIESSRNRSLLIGGGIVVLIMIGASFMLLRGQRRLQAVNSELQQSLERSETLQQERSALQQNMQQIERLDSLGLLAGGFAHDFNNILVGVRGNAQLLQELPDLQDRPKMLAEIVHASERATNLCKDILSYAHSAPTPKDALDIREVLESVVPLAKSGLGAGVTLTTDLGAEPAPVFANRSQIEQVFLNILINAGDAIKDQGRIVVTVDDARLDGKPPSGNWFGEFSGKPVDCVAITVLDNGQGMDPETVRRIFDPFFTTRFAGRGLGLAAVFGILRRHDGIVEVQSELHHGTQFTIYLPRHVQAVAESEPLFELPSSPPVANQPPRQSAILVVDDEPSVREVAKAALEIDGHSVWTAPDYTSALDLAERRGTVFGIALVDVTMPDVDGPKLARLLTAKCPHLRIIMMTGHAESHVHLNDLEAPLLTKPFDLTHLRQVVQDRLAATTT